MTGSWAVVVTLDVATPEQRDAVFEAVCDALARVVGIDDMDMVDIVGAPAHELLLPEWRPQEEETSA